MVIVSLFYYNFTKIFIKRFFVTLFYIINLIVLSSVVGYFAWRLEKNFWVFFIISLLFSPILGGLFLAIYDYYTIFLKGKK